MEPQDRDLLTRALDVLEAQNEHAAQDQHERVALVKALAVDDEPEPDHEHLAERSRQWIAKAEAAQHDRALAALGARDTSGPAVLAKSAGDLAALARLSARLELRERLAAQPPADHRGRLSWQVHEGTATIDETVAMVEQLAAAG